MILASLIGLCLAASPVLVDAEKHAVTFTAVSTDCGLDMQLEFLFVGPESDRDYESMFVTEASVSELAEGFRKAGIPCGRPTDVRASRFWPVGNALELKPSFAELVREMRGDKTPSVVFTGGTRDEKGVPEAQTNMPGAVFALYTCGQSLVQLDDALDQSTTYGRFQPAVKIPKGEKRTFTISWNGETCWEPYVLKLEHGKIPDALLTLKEKSSARELDVTTDFSSDLTLKEAIGVATALSMLDSPRVKLNGAASGQFFYRAFLPQEKWRDRKERLAQPPEVHLTDAESAKVVEILEDWSDSESLEPKLSAKEHIARSVSEAGALIARLGERTQTALVFAPESISLKRLYDLLGSVKGTNILNWYVFTE